VARPVSLKVGTSDFTFAVGLRRIAIGVLAGTLNFAEVFSIAVASSEASTGPSHTALLAIL
jgi:hypothetical protein